MSASSVGPVHLVGGEGKDGRLAAQVAHRIEADIIRRRWPVGAVLGSEHELRERYDVSRAVLREAVRLVEHHQVGRMRRGPNGGLLVCAPDTAPATRAIVIYLEYIGLNVDDLMQARRLLEPLAAALASERITETGIARLRDRLDDAVPGPDRPDEHPHAELHVLLGELTGNAALHLFIDVLNRLTSRYVHGAGRVPPIGTVRRVLPQDTHAMLVDAVISGDSGRAEAVMASHLDQVGNWFADTGSPRSGGADRQVSQLVEVPGVKLAEVVAARIHDEISRRDWPVGQVLGGEGDLLARYGISRAVLREAVRLLEYHSVARMRRGPGGGLVVTAPDPAASIGTMALYLDYRGVTPEDLRTIRDAIELGCLGVVTARREDREVEAVLRAALARSGEPTAPGRTGADRFHTALADLSGNSVLGLFLRILTELWNRHTAGKPTAVHDVDAVRSVEATHGGILDALLSGDEGMARHRLRRHLEALTAWYD